MRNLRKYFAVLVAVALLVTAMAPAFAADTATTAPAKSDAEICTTLGMIVGDGGKVDDAYLAKAPTKIQSAIMFLRLKGLEKEAIAYKGTDNFKDADKVDWAEGKAILGYLKSKPELGFIGDGTNFDPNAAITAQQYYKILLVALGYKEDTGKGGDFKFDDTVKFAEGKGLKAVAAVKSFAIKDIATATVEALKANVSGATKTLIATLVGSKAVDAAKAETAGIYSSKMDFALTNGAKKLVVKFTSPVADTAKVTLTITRDGGAAVTDLTAAWNTAKDEATLSRSTNLVAGEYKVAVKNDTADLGSKTVTIAAEKLAKIELTSKLINRRSDTEGVAYYKVTNQYGENVTTSSLANSITWNSSLGSGSVTADKGTLTFTKGTTSDTTYMAKLKDYTTVPVVVTAYETESSISFSDSLTVSNTVGDIQSVKLLGISNADKKTTIEKGGTDIFYIDYEIKDSNGNLVTDYTILNNTAAFTLSPKASSESSVIYAQVIQDPNDNKKAKIQLKNDGITNQIAGTQVVSAIALTTGKSATINVEVKEGTNLKEFIISKPVTDVAVNDGKVEVPYVALDSNGNAITDYSKIKDHVTFSGLSAASIDEVQKADGSYGLFMDFGASETTYTITATVTTTTSSKMSQMTVSVKDAAYPYDITAINKGDCPQGVVYEATVGVGADKLTIADQYGRANNFKQAWNASDAGLTSKSITNIDAGTTAVKFYTGKDGSLYYVAMSSSDANVMTVVSQAVYGTSNSVKYGIITGDKAAQYTPYATRDALGTNSATLNFSLRKIAPANATSITNLLDSTKYTEVDTFSYVVYNVDRKQITKYEFDAVANTLYAADNMGVTGRAFADNYFTRVDGNEFQVTSQQRAWDQEFKLRGYYNNIRTLVPVKYIKNYSVADPDKFALKGTPAATALAPAPTAVSLETSAYVLAKGWSTNDQAATFKSKLSATVEGYNGVFSQATIDITASKATPAAASINVARKDYAPVYSVGTDYYKVSKADFDAGIVGKSILKYSPADGSWTNTNASGRSYIFFTVKDQYTKEGAMPASIQVIKLVNNAMTATSGTAVTVSMDTGVVTNTETSAVGDKYKITIVTTNGVSKTVTLEII